jgi:hypothetical protein
VKEAISDFSLALHYKFPRDYAVLNNRAWCYENLGDYALALADYREGNLRTTALFFGVCY